MQLKKDKNKFKLRKSYKVLIIIKNWPFSLEKVKKFKGLDGDSLEFMYNNSIIGGLGIILFLLQRKLKNKIIPIGNESSVDKSYGKFIFTKGGFMKIIKDNNIKIEAHFSSKNMQKKFVIVFKQVTNFLRIDNQKISISIE